MAANIKRSGSALVLGAIGGALDGSQAPLPVPGGLAGITSVHVGTALEMATLVGGAIMQMVSPYTQPDFVDGAVDGAAAILASKLGAHFATTPYPASLQAVRGWAATRVAPQAGATVHQTVERYS